MTNDPSCANCGVALKPDAPEGSICVDCAHAAASAASEDFTPTVAAEGATPALSTGSASIRANAQPLFERIGDFEVLDKLGQGGMGAVYRARQLSLDRLVALKILPSQFQEDESFVGRFRREATVAASLNHPNLVRVYSSGEADGVHYIAMELVEGENLRQFLRRAGPMPPLHALRLCLGVARGLQAGWNKAQLIHRDIKPSNIYLALNGEVKLGDLGLAKSLLGNTTGITHTGTAIGTPHYVSPEQARGDKTIDCRADIYSLGCTLYELLTGATPYKGSDPLTIMNMHINSPPPAILKVLPQCPVPVARLVGKMLRKKPHERHQSYDELVAAMEAAIDQLENPNTGPSAVVQAWKEIGKAEQSFLPVKATALSANLPSERPASATKVPAATAPAAKSKALVWAGLAVAVVVLGALGFIFLPGSNTPRDFQKSNSKAPATHPSTPPLSAPLPSAIEARAIKLWDSPDTIHPSTGVAWAKDALRLDKRGMAPSNVSVRDVIIRASVLANADAQNVKINLRRAPQGTGRATGYFLQVAAKEGVVHLSSVRADQGAKLARWPFPRSYRADEWLNLEFRAIGDTLTVFLDGRPLGTVHDNTISDPGTFEFYAEAGGYFRDISYIPLDGLPGAEGLKLATANPGSVPTGATTTAGESKPSMPQWQDALDPNFPQTVDSAGWHAPGSIRMRADSMANLGVRVRYRGNRTTEANFPQINLRNKQRVHPNLQIDPDGKRVKIRMTDQGYPTLAVAPLTSPLTAGMEYAVEFYAIGSTLIGRVNGDTVTAQSPLPPEAGGFNIDPHDYFRNAQVLNLDGLPEAEALKLASASPSPSPTNSEWRDLLAEADLTRGVVRGTWKKVAGGVELEKPGGPGVLEFDYPAPSDYEFEIEFTPTSSGNNVNQHLSMGRHSFIWKMNAHARKPPSYGLDMVGGKTCSEPGGVGTVHDVALEPGKRYKSRVIVHPGRVQAFFNDVEYLAWAGDPQQLTTNPLDAPPRDPQHLGLGSWGRGVIFHRAAVRPVGGTLAASATTPATYPQPGQWIDATYQVRSGGLPEGTVKQAGEWLEATQKKGFVLQPGRTFSDVAMRVVFSGTVALKVRQTFGTGAYAASVDTYQPPASAVVLNVEGPPGSTPDRLDGGKKSFLDLNPGAESHEMVLSARGDQIELWMDGRRLARATDTRQRTGRLELVLNDIPNSQRGRIKKVEYGEFTVQSTSADAEPWQDVLRDPAKLSLQGGATLTPAGLRLASDGRAVVQLGRASPRDCAVRIRTPFSDISPVLRIRTQDAGFYYVKTSATVATLWRWNTGAKVGTRLTELPLPAPLRAGQDYSLEIRAVGQTLTAKLNGKTLGQVTDAAFSEGTAGVTMDQGSAPVLIKSLEVLDLDTSVAVSPPANATKEQPFVNSLGMKFVPVPITGGPTNGQRVLFSIWETRRQDYRAFVSETNREWAEPKPLFQQGATHPAVMVGWEDATAFCAWLTKREREAKKIGARESYRLPTDHEWSCAAGIGAQEDPAEAPESKSAKTNEPTAMVGAWPPLAPTGNYGGEEIQPVLTAGVATGEFPATAKPLSEYRDQFVNTAPVGSFPASRLGLHDLDGNVREYCADAPDPGKEQRILRGGSWLSNFRAALLPARRTFTTRRSPTGIDGFRVVLTEE